LEKNMRPNDHLESLTPLQREALEREPKRERFNSQEDYEEALAFHKHRVRHLFTGSHGTTKSKAAKKSH
jgi:hypothetical protein